MKLKSSKKDKAEKKQAQELYPKVKTFSKAYDYSPVSKAAPAAAVRNAQAFLPDERPYPVVPESVPVSAAPEEDYDDPERIDLQDTLLTDESFFERVPHHRPSVPERKAEEIAVPAEEPSESEETEPLYKPEPEAEYEADSFPGFGPCAGSEPDPEPDPEPDTDFFYMPDSDEESDPGLPPVFESGADLPAEADEEPVSPADSDDESAEPFSWFGTETDLPELQDEGERIIAFKEKKYSVEIGKKTNLKKKLASRPRGSLKWKSSDKKIAKVSKKGILKPRKKGKVTVKVKTKGGGKAKVRIRVRPAGKAKSIPWENVGSGKKKTYEKNWSIFA